MKFFKNEEEAVSPVIGVILMVAIVVILAAVIAAFVFGMAGSTGSSKNVGMTTSVNNTVAAMGVDVLWQGGTDINSMNGINATFNGAYASSYIPANQTEFNVGQITYIKTSLTDMAGVRVIITGSFSDGSTQVIFDRRF